MAGASKPVPDGDPGSGQTADIISLFYSFFKKAEKNMAGASKPVPDGDPGSGQTADIISLFYSFFKKVSMVCAVYAVGYMQWSVAWLLGPVVLSVIRDSWRRQSEYRRALAKSVAVSSEKDVVLARINDLPAWVFFPDVERAEWLNRILLQVWPNVNHYARSLLKDTIEPAVAESLAGFKLSGFKFERMILGSIAPRVGGVKVYDKNLSRDEIIMDVDLFYAGDCDISFVLSGVKGGIKDLQIHGMLRVVMKPLIRNMPLVGGLQIFFLNNPDIDFNLVGVADVLDMPGLSDILRRCIVEQVARMMVLPNKLPIKLSDEVPTQDLRMPEPEGVLRIHLIEAKNLMKKDIGMLGKGKSDPYAIITVGAQQFKTKHIDNNVNPKFDFWCEALISSRKCQALACELWDWDPGLGIQNDDFLGRCSLDIAQVVRAGRMDTWQTLQQAKHGMVRLILSWHRLSPNNSDLSAALLETQLFKLAGLSAGVLTVYIDSCKNLPSARTQSKPDPYLTLSLGRKTENSGVQLRTASPVYEIGYSFLVTNPETDTLRLKVLDQKTGSTLGELEYALAPLLRQAELTVLMQPLALHKSGPESKLIMSMCLRILSEAISEDAQSDEVSEGGDVAGEVGGAGAGDELAPPSSATASVSDSVSTSASVTPSPVHKTPLAPLPAAADSAKFLLEELFVKDTDSAELQSERSAPQTTATVAAEVAALAASAPGPTPPGSPKLVHRNSTVTSSAGEAGLGRIQLTLRYSVQRQTLVVVVHKIMNIPLKDPNNIPDPYVKLYLLPGRTKDRKRKTAVMRDNCNPVYDESFEYSVAGPELGSRMLEVTVASHKSFLGVSPVLGQVIVNLAEYDFSQAQTFWFDLLPEAVHD